jgi:hypothetical protein
MKMRAKATVVVNTENKKRGRPRRTEGEQMKIDTTSSVVAASTPTAWSFLNTCM